MGDFQFGARPPQHNCLERGWQRTLLRVLRQNHGRADHEYRLLPVRYASASANSHRRYFRFHPWSHAWPLSGASSLRSTRSRPHPLGPELDSDVEEVTNSFFAAYAGSALSGALLAAITSFSQLAFPYASNSLAIRLNDLRVPKSCE